MDKKQDYPMRSLESGLLERPDANGGAAAAADDDDDDNLPASRFLPLRRHPRLAVASLGVGASLARLEKSPGLSILAYCLSSISMTVVNKYVVSGDFWNLNFFYLAVQVRHGLGSVDMRTKGLTDANVRPSSASLPSLPARTLA